MIRLSSGHSDRPAFSDCIAHRCEAHRDDPAFMKPGQEAECGKCVAEELTLRYGLSLEEDRLDLLDGYAEALTVGAKRNHALWVMSNAVYGLLDRLRLVDLGLAEREFQALTNEGGLPPKEIVAFMLNRYSKESPDHA